MVAGRFIEVDAFAALHPGLGPLLRLPLWTGDQFIGLGKSEISHSDSLSVPDVFHGRRHLLRMLPL